MRLLLDESLPRRLTQHLGDVEVDTVFDRGWSGLKNGELLRTAESDYDAGLCERHGVQSLRLFGSAARGEERADSDIDLLVRFVETKGLLEIVRIERDFSEYFGRPVDLVTEGQLSPYIRGEVLAQAAPLYGPRG